MPKTNLEKIDLNALFVNNDGYGTNTIPFNSSIFQTIKRLDELPISGIKSRYSDSVWDFTSITNLPIVAANLKIIFDNNSYSVDLLKGFCLYRLLSLKNKVRSVHHMMSDFRVFIRYFESLGYKKIETVPQELYEKYFEEKAYTYHHESICRANLANLLIFYKNNFNVPIDSKLIQYLQEVDTAKRSLLVNEARTPEIPPEYLKRLVELCIQLMRDDRAPFWERFVACGLVLYSQIGFRPAELHTLTINSLESLQVEGKRLSYLRYKSFKRGKGDNGWIDGKTYVNTLSVEAFNKLIYLCKIERERINSDILLVYPAKDPIKRANYIFTSLYREFCIQHYKYLDTLNSSEKYPGFVEIHPKKGIDKHFYTRLHLPSLTGETSFNFSDDDTIYYPNLYQFRVSFCTNAVRLHIPLEYLRRHMNHIKIDTTLGYYRREKSRNREFTEKFYNSIVNEKAKLIGNKQNIVDDFVGKIDQFIKNDAAAVCKNDKEIIKLISDKYPLRTTEAGICLKSGETIHCKHEDQASQIACLFGMCPNLAHAFFTVHHSYHAYELMKMAVEHNKNSGFQKGYSRESMEIRYFIEKTLLPQLDLLVEEIESRGEEVVQTEYPEIKDIVDNIETIYTEVTSWLIPN